jgi:hypothetical protein
MDQAFGFSDEVDQVIFVNIAGEQEINDRAVESIRELAYEVDFADLPETFDDRIHDRIESDVFDQDIMDFLEEGVVRVGLEVFLVAFGIGLEHAGLFEAVEFLADGIGGVPKFGFQSAEIGAGTAIEKKLQQKLDPRFGRNEGLDHSVSDMIE